MADQKIIHGDCYGRMGLCQKAYSAIRLNVQGKYLNLLKQVRIFFVKNALSNFGVKNQPLKMATVDSVLSTVTSYGNEVKERKLYNLTTNGVQITQTGKEGSVRRIKNSDKAKNISHGEILYSGVMISLVKSAVHEVVLEFVYGLKHIILNHSHYSPNSV